MKRVERFHFFVTGTDTGVGKTEVSCALLSQLREMGRWPFAFKPVETGIDSRSKNTDAQRLWQAAGAHQKRADVCLIELKTPVAPAIAARIENRNIQLRSMVKHVEKFRKNDMVVEGAGGIFAPLTDSHEVIDLIVQLKLQTVVVARATLGTLNHTLLTVRALEARKVKVVAVVLSHHQKERDASFESNASCLQEKLKNVRIIGPVKFEPKASTRRKRMQGALKVLFSA